MGVFTKIKQFKDDFQHIQRVKTQERLKQVKAELEVVKAEQNLFSEDAKARKSLRESKKALFEAKHPLLSGAVKHVGKKIQENKKAGKGIFADANTTNPFQPTKQKKGKGPGEGIFY